MAANPSIQLGTDGNWAIKEDNLLAYKKDGTRFFNKEFDFTRGSLATFVDKDGLIKISGVTDTELVTNGDFATDSDWQKSSTATISNGSAHIVSDGSYQYIRQGSVLTVGKKYRVEYEIVENNSGNLKMSSSFGSNFSPISSTVGFHSFEAVAIISTLYIERQTACDIKIDNVSVVEIQTDVPRIDFTDDVTGHLLLEPQSTNLFPYSEDFENSDWNKNAGTTITNNYAISPDGTQTAARYLGTGSSGLGDKFTLSAADHTISFWVKSNNGSNQFCRLIGESSQVSSDILVTTEWNRISYTFTASGLSDKTNGIFRDSSNNDIDILIYGAQLEEKSYPTSYIPTYGSSATRNADLCNNSGSAQDFNSEEGVLYAEIAALADNLTNRVISLSDGTANERVVLQFHNTTNRIRGFIKSGGTFYATLDKVVSDTTDFHKIAYKYKSGETKLFIDGSLANTSSNTFSITGLNVLQFANGTPTASPFYGKTKNLKVFKRAMSDEELQQLTT
jgi:hypothetical protein